MSLRIFNNEEWVEGLGEGRDGVELEGRGGKKGEKEGKNGRGEWNKEGMGIRRDVG